MNQDGSASDVRFLKNGHARAVRRLRRAQGGDAVIGLTGQRIGQRFSATAKAAGIAGRITGP